MSVQFHPKLPTSMSNFTTLTDEQIEEHCTDLIKQLRRRALLPLTQTHDPDIQRIKFIFNSVQERKNPEESTICTFTETYSLAELKDLLKLKNATDIDILLALFFHRMPTTHTEQGDWRFNRGHFIFPLKTPSHTNLSHQASTSMSLVSTSQLNGSTKATDELPSQHTRSSQKISSSSTANLARPISDNTPPSSGSPKSPPVRSNGNDVKKTCCALQ